MISVRVRVRVRVRFFKPDTYNSFNIGQLRPRIRVRVRIRIRVRIRVRGRVRLRVRIMGSLGSGLDIRIKNYDLFG
jgi:hypothetical protein